MTSWFARGALWRAALVTVVCGTALAQDAAHSSFRATARNAHVVVPQSRAFPLDARTTAVEVAAVRARIAIDGRTARTTLEMELRNPGGARAESVLLVPVPAGAAVRSFDFDGAGAEPSAELLPAAEARRIYDDIVRRARDPALLEFAGSAFVRSSVFPVEPHGTQHVRLTWEEVLPGDGARVDYLLPRSGALDVRTPWDVSFDVRSDVPLATVYSPTHALETERLGPGRVRVRVAAAARDEPGDLRVSFLREPREGAAATLYTYPEPGGDGGSFLFLASVPRPKTTAVAPRDVVLVLDRSGSMAGAKLEQARAAALQVIEGLEDGERFDVVDYATDVARFAPRPVPKTRESVGEVRAYLDALRPAGGTNLHDALAEALRMRGDGGALPIVLFLTDGLPTVGRRSETEIAGLVGAADAQTPRVFTFGVGLDVNAPLLDRIAERTRAFATYVRPEDDVELAVDRVFRNLRGPVLAAPELTAQGDDGSASTRRIHECIPAALPDVYDGDAAVVLGRYRGTGTLRLRLTGTDTSGPRAFEFAFDLGEATTANAFVPRLWATRRIAFLTDEVRQAAEEVARGAPDRTAELTEEIVRLSTQYGVLTEYTAFLAREGSDLARWGDLVASCGAELRAQSWGARSGSSAVAQAVNFNARRQQTTLNGANAMLDANLNQVSYTNVQQTADRAFFRRGGTWIDGSLAGAAERTPDRVVEYGSDEHLRLLGRLVLENRQAALALRGDIVLLVDGQVVLVRNPDDC